MSIASSWRDEKPAKPGEFVRPMSRTTADRISAKVIEATADDGASFGRAAHSLMDGMRRKVTFRRSVAVPFWFGTDRHRQTFNELPKVVVDAGTRGTVVAIMVDGHDMVKLHDGRQVLARVGEDCRLLGRWYRLVDWFKCRRFA